MQKPKAKQTPHYYRRNLPHFQGDGGPLYITFCTKDRWLLPESVRDKVLDHCLHDHGTKIHLHCAVVMPDHVHLVYHPLTDREGNFYSLEEVLGGLKGASAHSVNRLLKRKGAVWQNESFDHALRSSESLWEKVEYVQHNPVRKGLCPRPEDYPWLWVDENIM
jgi:REP element-mobilizing transposase RayT